MYARLISTVFAMLFLAACSVAPKVPYSTDFDPLAEMPDAQGGIEDDRGRFREIFCAVLEERGEGLPDYMPCEEALTTVGVEPAATGEPIYLGSTRANYLVGVVPGLGWDCIEGWLDPDNSGINHIAEFGYESAFLEVDGLSSTAKNAGQINERLANLSPDLDGRPIILIGYSKGSPDILDFLARYPDTAKRVVAVVSVAGAVSGSPLAIEGSQDQANILTKMPGAKCDEGDGGAVEALHPDVRRQWLADHPLPKHISFYSIVTYPDPETRMSKGLKSSYNNLAEMADARNDSQVVFYDQVIPGSTLLAFPNADHWAIAVPIARQHSFVGSTFVNRNNYPREAFFEALVRYLEEDLASQ